MIKNKINKDRFFKILPYIWMVLAYLITFIVIYFKGRPYVDADMAAEMVLANILNKEGGLLSTNWYYSTEIRVFYLQIIYKLTLILFPNNWYLAIVIGNALWAAILIASYFFVCGKKGLNLKNNGALGAACLSLPFSILYFWYGLYAGSYLPHMILVLISLGLIIRFYNNSSEYIYIILLAVVSLVNGLGSVKGIMGFYCPMVLASLILFVYEYKKTPNSVPKNNLKLVIASLIALLFSGIGYLINTHILANVYSFASEHSRYWSYFNFNVFIDNLSDLVNLLGVLNPKYWDTGVSLFSIKGILGCFAYVTIAIFFFSLYSIIKNFYKLNDNHRLISMISLTCILFQAFILSFTSGSDPLLPYYWLTILPLVFFLFEVGIESINFKIIKSPEIIKTVLLLSLTCTSLASVKTFFDKPFYARPSLEKVTDFLVENNYTKGIANVWDTNEITLWSNGEIEMWTFTDNLQGIREWLQSKEHQNIPEGQIFLLTTYDDLEHLNVLYMYEHSNVVYENTEGDIVMLFDTYNDFLIDYWYAIGLNELEK